MTTTGILILCTHNSARSVLAEGMLAHWARRLESNVRAYSAGSTPSGRVHPLALEVLAAAGVDCAGLRSKSWDAFAGPDAPEMHFVFTVCDNAANEACPVWPGQPMTAHWGVPDPATVCDNAAAETCPVFHGVAGRPVRVHWGYPDPSAAGGDEQERRRAFELTRQAIGYRMLQLLALPLEDLTPPELQSILQYVGTT